MRNQISAVLPPVWEDWIFASDWAFQGISEGILGIAWKNKREWEARLAPQLYVTFIECKTSEIKYQDRYQWTGIDMEEIQLWPDIALDDWIVTWEASDPANILLCPIHWGMPLSSVIPTIIDTVTAPMTRMGPIVFVAATEQDIRVVHLQPILDDTSPPVALVSRVAKKHLGKSRHTGFMTSALEYLRPGGAIQVKRVDNDAFKAGAIVEGQAWYLITFDAEYNENEDLLVELPEIGFRKVVQGKPYWRMAIAGGSLPMPKLTWKHSFHMRIPATAYPNDDFMDDAVVGACLIAGPTRIFPQQKKQATVIIAVGLIKKEALGLPEEQARSLRGGELICLSQDGQVVQECKEEIVEQVELCLVGDTVIGVDRIQRRWRLWRWEPLAGKEQFTTVQWLDEEVVHAHVVTNHENSDPQGAQFWLVEERPEGLRVSRRDGQTLEETEEPLGLQHYSLPYSLERSIGHWDWPIKKGLIGHEDALLLIAADEENRMVLYRVEVGI